MASSDTGAALDYGNATRKTAELVGGVSNSTGAVLARADDAVGVGLEWLRSWLGRSEWSLPCLDVKIRL